MAWVIRVKGRYGDWVSSFAGEEYDTSPDYKSAVLFDNKEDGAALLEVVRHTHPGAKLVEHRQRTPWRAWEHKFLKENLPNLTIAQAAQQLGRTSQEVYQVAYRLGLNFRRIQRAWTCQERELVMRGHRPPGRTLAAVALYRSKHLRRLKQCNSNAQ